MSWKRGHLLNLPTDIIVKILENLDDEGGLERFYGYPKATALGRPAKRPRTDGGYGGNFDAISRCNHFLRGLCLPYLFRYIHISVVEEEAAMRRLDFFLQSAWVLQFVRKLYFVMDIRAWIVAELPLSVMKPDLSILMNMIARFFQAVGNLEDLHFIIRSEVVSNGLRRVFLSCQHQLQAALCNVQSLKFSAGSEWIIRFCGSYSGLRELENSPGISGSEYIPYFIDFAQAPEETQRFGAVSKTTTYFSQISDCRAANILKGIVPSLGNMSLVKVCIYGKFTPEGLAVFIGHIPAVSQLTIIGEVMPEPYAHILGRLQDLRILNIQGDINESRDEFGVCPVGPSYLYHFARYIPSLQQMWFAARFVGQIHRDFNGNVISHHIAWKDTWEEYVDYSATNMEFDVDMDE